MNWMYEYYFEIRPIFHQTVEAESYEDAVEILKASIACSPLVVDDITDREIKLVGDTTYETEVTKDMEKRLGEIAERCEQFGTTESVTVLECHFKEEDLDDEETDVLNGRFPEFIYADVHIWDGGEGLTIHKGVQYRVSFLQEMLDKINKKEKVK